MLKENLIRLWITVRVTFAIIYSLLTVFVFASVLLAGTQYGVNILLTWVIASLIFFFMVGAWLLTGRIASGIVRAHQRC